MSLSIKKLASPYGLWKSTFTPNLIANKLKFSDVQYFDSGLLWLEGRPTGSVLTYNSKKNKYIDIAPQSQPSGGLAYGGGEFHTRLGIVVFVNKDGSISQTSIDNHANQLSITDDVSVSSPAISGDGKYILYLQSDGKDDSINILDITRPNNLSRLVYGADFYMQPVWHPEGELIAWVEWNAPNMPWDGTIIIKAQFDKSTRSISAIQNIAGDTNTPVFQPEFSPDSNFLSYLQAAGDRDELVILDLHSGVKSVTLKDKIMITPAWTLGQRVYGWSSDSRSIFCIYQEKGEFGVMELDLENSTDKELDLSPYSNFSQITVSPIDMSFACIASSPEIPARIIEWNNGEVRVVRSSLDLDISPREISYPQPVEWKTSTGEVVHGFYFPPQNSKFSSDGLPPAVIHIHGGPTSQVDSSFSFDTNFFTNRGYAVLVVNYRGSTGYGRNYQQALNQHWGEYDVEDTVSAVHFLIESGLANPKQLVIKGSSAGGYTLLNVLIRYPDLFQAAICSFPVANLIAIINETFKFEAHYYDSLIGPFPEEKEKYINWSPINHIGKIRTPIILFHGDSDPVVPSSQSEEIVDALTANHVPYHYQLFKDEGHGWKKAETLETYYNLIEQFLLENIIKK
jgi:dipeptidyl aminopeptidase/acylaminoacyl peptidase